MDRLIFNDGPIARALRSYDHNVRIRWSWEKKQWAVEAKALREQMILPPVRWERVEGFRDLWREHLLPERSDRYISYHTGYYVIGWTPRLHWGIVERIAAYDLKQFKNRDQAVKDTIKKIEEQDQKRKLKQRLVVSDVHAQAFDHFKFLNRKRPWGDPIGAGYR